MEFENLGMGIRRASMGRRPILSDDETQKRRPPVICEAVSMDFSEMKSPVVRRL